MLVITLSDCPPRLRGDLSKWLIEINTGVYVGRVSARVRDEIWKRVRENLPHGRATMVFSAANEQRMSFRVHHTSWEPVDYEGLTLVRRPLAQQPPLEETSTPRSKAAIQQQARRMQSAQARKQSQTGYVVIDVETTGLDSCSDSMIEVAAVKIVEHKPVGQMTILIQTKHEIPSHIVEITGITPEMLETEGVPLCKAMEQFREFVGDSPMVSHNIGFDRAFLDAACEQLQSPPLRNVCKDTLGLARRRVDEVPDYKLATLAEHFGIRVTKTHRALADCMLIYQLYEKLNEN